MAITPANTVIQGEVIAVVGDLCWYCGYYCLPRVEEKTRAEWRRAFLAAHGGSTP